jgi:preprotein translocase subunit Sec61beta
MAQQNEVNLPGFGGLMRYKEEYDSKFKISPTQVIVLIIAVIVFVLSLKLLFPLKVAVTSMISGLL